MHLAERSGEARRAVAEEVVGQDVDTERRVEAGTGQGAARASLQLAVVPAVALPTPARVAVHEVHAAAAWKRTPESVKVTRKVAAARPRGRFIVVQQKFKLLKVDIDLTVTSITSPSAVRAMWGLVALTALGMEWTEGDTVITTMNGISNITFIKQRHACRTEVLKNGDGRTDGRVFSSPRPRSDRPDEAAPLALHYGD